MGRGGTYGVTGYRYDTKRDSEVAIGFAVGGVNVVMYMWTKRNEKLASKSGKSQARVSVLLVQEKHHQATCQNGQGQNAQSWSRSYLFDEVIAHWPACRNVQHLVDTQGRKGGSE